jgi:regulator of sigma E protease
MIPHNIVVEDVKVVDVNNNSPAQMAGIETGNIILEINNREVRNRSELTLFLQRNLGKKTDILVQESSSNPATKEVTLKPRWRPPEGEGAVGIAITGENSTIEKESYPIWKAIPISIRHCWEILIILRNEIAGWFIKGTAAFQVTGPVGIAQMTGEFVKAGLSPLLEFAALISISLGVFNLFPFPGLDGGRLVFVALEWIRRGKRISPRKEGYVHLVGFFILISLLLVVTYFDVLRIIQGESLLP